MTFNVKKIVVSSIIFTVIDLLWLKFYMTEKYNIMIPKIQGSKLEVNVYIAALAYLTLCFALNYFVLPNVQKNNFKLFSHSFIFGAVLYAVYDFTCGAIFKKFNKKLMFIDIIWGGVVFALSNYLANLLFKK